MRSVFNIHRALSLVPRGDGRDRLRSRTMRTLPRRKPRFETSAASDRSIQPLLRCELTGEPGCSAHRTECHLHEPRAMRQLLRESVQATAGKSYTLDAVTMGAAGDSGVDVRRPPESAFADAVSHRGERRYSRRRARRHVVAELKVPTRWWTPPPWWLRFRSRRGAHRRLPAASPVEEFKREAVARDRRRGSSAGTLPRRKENVLSAVKVLPRHWLHAIDRRARLLALRSAGHRHDYRSAQSASF